MIEVQKLNNGHAKETAKLIVESFENEMVTCTVLDKNEKGVDELYANVMEVFIKMSVDSNQHSIVVIYDKK